MIQLFSKASTLNSKRYNAILQKLNEKKSKRLTYITGRDNRTYGVINLDEYLTKEEADETFLTKDNIGDTVEQAVEDALDSLVYTDSPVDGSFVTSVNQEEGKISVTRGMITSIDESIEVTSTDSNVDLSVTTIITDEIDKIFE